MVGTQPDLAFTVGLLGQHTTTLKQNHLCTLDRIFCYLQGTAHWKLTFQHNNRNSLSVLGYTDMDWANNASDCKLTSRFVFLLAGGAISWSSKKQSSVALSSTEAKYIAGMHTAKELI